MIKEYKTIEAISYPLVTVGGVQGVSRGELAEVVLPDGKTRRCMVLEADGDKAHLQLFDCAAGINLKSSRVRFLGHGLEAAVSEDLLGRVFDFYGKAIDGGADIIAEAHCNINGAALNPDLRDGAGEAIETGIPEIDSRSALMRGKRLAVLSCGGLSHMELVSQIARSAGDCVVIYGAMGVSFEESECFVQEFRRSGFIDKSVVFASLAGEPSARSVVVPRMALTAAEYLAFEKDMQVLVILSDMCCYADALRETAAAKKELLGRDGYPLNLPADIAALFERGGRRVGKSGSVSLVSVVTALPTHPVAEAVCSASDDKIVLSTEA